MMKPKFLFKAKMKHQDTEIIGSYLYSEKDQKHYIIGESKDYGFQKVEIDTETLLCLQLK
jgi:hypothetical protein